MIPSNKPIKVDFRRVSASTFCSRSGINLEHVSRISGIPLSASVGGLIAEPFLVFHFKNEAVQKVMTAPDVLPYRFEGLRGNFRTENLPNLSKEIRESNLEEAKVSSASAKFI